MKLMEEKIQDVLIEILKEFGIPENFYSLGGYAEETVCLEKKVRGQGVNGRKAD